MKVPIKNNLMEIKLEVNRLIVRIPILLSAQFRYFTISIREIVSMSKNLFNF